MKNQYKIDYNKYADVRFPYALYVREPGYFTKWEFVKSCETKEEARNLHKLLTDLPEYL